VGSSERNPRIAPRSDMSHNIYLLCHMRKW
jgi:hypothetical protein